MSLLVVPNLRIDEINSRSKLHCSNCFKNLILSESRSNFCVSRLEEKIQNLLTFCRQCYESQPQRNRCVHLECENLAIKIVESVQNFYNVPCSDHRLESTHFLQDSFIPVCPNCSYSEASRNNQVHLTYSAIEDSFFDLISRTNGLLCKDRLKRLISRSTIQLLSDCRWLSELYSGLFCSTHKTTKAVSINSYLEGLCHDCHSDQEFFPLSSINETVSAVVDILRAKSLVVSPRCLNQFMIQVLKRTFTISNPRDLALLVLEGRSLLAAEEFEDVRCVECCNKICLGWYRGISLECGHVICYKCLASGHCQNCPLDMKEVKYSLYYPWNYLVIPVCHVGHEFDEQETIWKLPCFHYSCDKHQAIENCYECGFNRRKWELKLKKSSYAENLLEFLRVKCLKHNLPITNVNCNPFSLQCEKCEEYQSKTSLKGLTSLSVKPIEKMISDRLQMFKYDDISNRKLDNNAIKLISNIGLKNLSDVFRAFCLVESMHFQCSSISAKPLLFYSSSSCSKLASRSLYKIQVPFKIVLRFKCNSDLLCKGLVLGYSFIPYKPPFHLLTINPSRITYQKIFQSNNSYISKQELENFCKFELEIEKNDENLEEFSKKARNVEFSSLIYLESNEVFHEFVIEMVPGRYFMPKPFSKLKNINLELLKINKNLYGEGLVLSGALSSPLFGLLISKAVDN